MKVFRNGVLLSKAWHAWIRFVEDARIRFVKVHWPFFAEFFLFGFFECLKIVKEFSKIICYYTKPETPETHLWRNKRIISHGLRGIHWSIFPELHIILNFSKLWKKISKMILYFTKPDTPETHPWRNRRIIETGLREVHWPVFPELLFLHFLGFLKIVKEFSKIICYYTKPDTPETHLWRNRRIISNGLGGVHWPIFPELHFIYNCTSYWISQNCEKKFQKWFCILQSLTHRKPIHEGIEGLFRLVWEKFIDQSFLNCCFYIFLDFWKLWKNFQK